MSACQPLWTALEAARATGGQSRGDWRAGGVSIDSRTLVPGDLFVALQGPRFDGHDYVRAALGAGAAAAMVARRPEGVDEDAPLLVVEDTLAGLQALGRHARARAGARVVGLTGSVGKTSSKEALRLALGALGGTHASEGSLNNHWGVPLSLARLSPAADFAVFEMGMNHAGEIAPLSRQVRPQVAAITIVEGVHIENFPSIEAIADAKAEIFLGVEPGGTAVLNRDNRYYERLARAARAAGVAHVLAFGAREGADVRLVDAAEDAAGSDVRAEIAGRPLRFRVGAPGRHWIGNALCVLATVHALGADVERAAAALALLSAPKGRGQRHRVRLGDDSFELIDDSYNASPPSMAASFQVLGRTPVGPGGRRIAVLGDMLELGETEAQQHAGLASPLVDSGVALVFTAGARMAHLHAALPPQLRAPHAEDSTAAAAAVAAAVRPGDVVVVKGSAGSRMRIVVDALLALDRPAATVAQTSIAGQER